jgi:mono/diheme cytochrome c family protein
MLALALGGCSPGADTSANPTATPLPPTLTRGGEVFARYCQACHPGGKRGVGPALIGTPLSDAEMTTVIRHGKANMPPFDPTNISDTELQNLLDYIHTLK